MPMQSRTDQVHAYQFFLQRVISGLVAKESDPAELPYRRLGWSGFGSVMLTVLLAAGFGIYGVVVGGGATSWRDGGSVILERDSGQVYVFRDDRLHPMVNLVSAQLALDGQPAVTRVSARSLRDVPRGTTLGIVGAPEALPDADRLLTGGWLLCSEQRPDGRGGQAPVSVLAVGSAAAGGQPTGDQALLIRDVDAADGEGADGEGADGEGAELHLVWRGHRHALERAQQTPALRALGVSRERALPVAAAWLDSVPVGEPLAPPAVADPGGATSAIPQRGGDLDLRVGQVIVSADTHYLVGEAELVEITPLAAQLLLAAPAAGEAYPGGIPDLRTDVPTALIAGAAVEPLPEPSATAPPERRPAFAALAPEDHRDGVICAEFGPGQFVPVILAGARLAHGEDALPTPERTEQGSLLVDRVLIAGGSAALVESIASPQAGGGSWHVVTDQGVRYPLPEPEIAARWGYQQEHAVRVPAGLLARLPAGPSLDPATATHPAPA